MGSEMPGGNRKKRKTPWNDDKSTNKVYASGNISALGDHHTVSDSTLKPGQEPPVGGNPTPTQKADDKSSDKYYANGGSNRVKHRAGAKKPALGPPPVLGKLPRGPQVRAAQNVVTNKDQINGVIAYAVDKVKNGEEAVIFVAKGNSDCLKRTRAALELMVTREVITEDQYRDIRLSYTTDGTEVAAAPPAPAKTVKVEEGDVGDPLAFLNSGDEHDEVVDTSPLPPVAVDTTADVKDPETEKIEQEVKKDAEDDDEGDDFLTPPKPPEERISIPADVITRLPDGPGLVETGETPAPHPYADGLDRAVATDEPVKVVDTEPVSPPADEDEGDAAPPPVAEAKKPGRRSGRGAK